MPGKAVIIDIDGTLADVTHRVHHVRDGKHDWDAFFDAMSEDPPKMDVIAVVETIALASEPEYGDADDAGAQFFICTGRPEAYRSVTVEWLVDNCPTLIQRVANGEGALLMRPDDDHRSDVEVKREMLKNIRGQGFEVVSTFDDRDSVVQMWRSEGITCFQCAPGDWETKQPVTPGTLHLLIGPSGAGKSTFALKRSNPGPMEDTPLWQASAIVSSDVLRAEINNGVIRDQSKNKQVFDALRALVKTRIEHGLDTVVDATNLRNRDRRTLREVAPRTSRIVYHVIDRPMEEKKRDAGWRADVVVKDQPLIEYHANIFNSNLKDILRGDGDQRVDVVDHRPEELKK